MNVSHFQLTPNADQFTQVLGLLRPFSVIRFMNWNMVNHKRGDTRQMPVMSADMPSHASAWGYRGGAWGAWRGVPVSVCVDVANACKARAWICLPHTLGHDAVIEIVREVTQRADQRPIFEWSNERWNDQFLQRSDDQSPIKRLAEAIDQAGGGADVVVGGQFFYEERTEAILKEVAGHVTALAVAPYIGRHIDEVHSDDDYKRIIEDEIVYDVAWRVGNYKAMADHYGVRLWAYEGGLHTVARSADLQSSLMRFNRSYQAGDVIRSLWDVWTENDGGIFCPYSLSTIYDNQRDFFGHVEIGKDGSMTILPKYEAVVSSAEKFG